jgi:hypothetical protein
MSSTVSRFLDKEPSPIRITRLYGPDLVFDGRELSRLETPRLFSKRQLSLFQTKAGKFIVNWRIYNWRRELSSQGISIYDSIAEVKAKCWKTDGIREVLEAAGFPFTEVID